MSQFSDMPPDYIREYRFEVLKGRIFGAFIAAIESRKDTQGLSQRQLAEGIGKGEDNTSKLLSAPRNWTLRTISDLAGALNLDFQFILVDKDDSTRVFTDTGMHRRVEQHEDAMVGQDAVATHSNVMISRIPTTNFNEGALDTMRRIGSKGSNRYEGVRIDPTRKPNPADFTFSIKINP